MRCSTEYYNHHNNIVMCNSQLPAGLLDKKVEIFAVAPFRVKCLHDSKVIDIAELPFCMLQMLKTEMRNDKKALKGLKMLGFTEEREMLEAYNHCKRGAFDKVPDISGHVLTSEQYECGMRGKCTAEGLICKPLLINGESLTQRETQCLRLLGQGMTYKQIQKALCYTTVASANSLVYRLYAKLGIGDKTKAAIIAAQVFNL